MVVVVVVVVGGRGGQQIVHFSTRVELVRKVDNRSVQCEKEALQYVADCVRSCERVAKARPLLCAPTIGPILTSNPCSTHSTPSMATMTLSPG